MTDLQKEFEATGYTSWINADLYPDGNIYTQEYTQWLEKQVLALRQPLVSGSFKHSMLDVWAFAEWAGQHYIRLHECWVHRFADQRNKDNWKDTGELWKLWWENYR